MLGASPSPFLGWYVEYRVQIRHRFDAGHQIFGHPSCGRVHGHRYQVEVESLLRYDPSKRQVTDTTDMQSAVGDLVKELEGRSLNDMIPGITPTPDGIATWIMERLLLSFPRIVRVTVWERPHCAFTVTREIES